MGYVSSLPVPGRNDSDLYSEVIYDEFVLCVGHLIAFSSSAAEDVRRQEQFGHSNAAARARSHTTP